MTILNDTTYARAPYRGWDNPQLPIGIWRASVVTVGDASGGLMIGRINFAVEGDPLSGEIFNLEQLTSFISDSTTRFGFFTTINMAPGQGSNFVNRIWRLEWRDTDAAGAGALADGLPILPIFLGGRQLISSSSPSSLDVKLVNLTAAASLSVTAMGYIWSGRSVLAEGGPLRPASALFG